MEDAAEKKRQILSTLKAKYRLVDNLMVFTKEMGKVVEINDLESLGAVLIMRRETMEKIDYQNSEISKVLNEMDQSDKEKIKRILESKCGPEEIEEPLEKDMYDTNKATLALLEKIVILDEEINTRIRQQAVPD